jgi:glycosyltransferase involved in cell wall biosynthesis
MKYVIDTHGGYFDDMKFQILPNLRKKIMEHALFHIVTNDFHKKIVESGNGKATVLGVLIERDDSVKKHDFENEKSFLWIASYSPDEPLEIVFDVARNMPDANIYITGNIKKAPKPFLEKCMKYKNIILTGFLPEEKFLSYLKGSTAVIALTTLDNTMQRGAYTALSYNVPIITSNWNLLRENFSKGTVHIDNTASALEQAMRRVCDHNDRFRKEIAELNGLHAQAFEQKILEIKKNLNA